MLKANVAFSKLQEAMGGGRKLHFWAKNQRNSISVSERRIFRQRRILRFNEIFTFWDLSEFKHVPLVEADSQQHP